MEKAITCVVDGEMLDVGVNPANAGQDVISRKLIEEVSTKFQMLGDLDIDQRVINDEISVRAPDQHRSLAE